MWNYCDFNNGTANPENHCHGKDAQYCAELAGKVGGRVDRSTTFRYFQDYEMSLGRGDIIKDRPEGFIWDVNECNGEGKFSLDGRGQYERAWLLGEEDYEFQFTR